MNDLTIPKLGWLFVMLLGIGYAASFISKLVMPEVYMPELYMGVPDHAPFFSAMAENPTPQLVDFWIWALTALVGIGAVMTISRLVRPHDESGLVAWATLLAYLGFAVQALDRFNHIGTIPELAERFAVETAAVQASISANYHLMRMDDNSWLTFGAVGLWLLLVNGVGLRDGLFPRTLAALGLLLGATFLLIPLPLPSIGTIITGAIAVLVGLLYFSWMGLRLRRHATSEQPASARATASAPAA